MEEEKGGSKGGGENGESTRNSSSLIAVGGRERFTVELKPGETTIVSWKKLSKDPSKANGFTPALEPPPNAQAVLESRIAPGQPAENEAKDAPTANRFSAVVEKIERLYMGKHSSDEEDLNDVPDDDEYDTQDSFIDDRELDEYFQVDNSAIKHDGFFVNRGKLERVEMASLPHEQLKKRRRKDLTKGRGDNDDGRVRNKHAKVGKEAAGGSLPLAGKNSSRPSYGMGAQLPNEHYEDGKFQNQENASVICSRKTHADIKTTLDRPPKVSNAAVTLSQVVEKDVDKQKTDKQKTGLVPSKSQGSKVKDVFESFDPSHQRLHDKSSYAQCKSQSGRLFNNVDNLEQTIHRKEKNDIREHPDINVSKGKYSTQTSWVPAIQRKATSGVRPKAKILERAIRELENTVAESRPPTTEVPDADVSSQAVKRRLPHEVKQKLTKVARLAANHGKMSEELIDRLMNILGHLIKLRTLKRNLKVMVNMGLSAKQEKDNRFQQIKKEVIEMIKMQVLSSNSKALVKQSGSSDDFQEIGNEKKEVKLKCSMDDAMEEKICDLYDLYVEGLEEHSGPQVRKLYAELAELWPSGLMDNHGIKRAICRVKDRKQALYLRHKDQEKIKAKKLLTPKTDETVHLEASSTAMPQHMQEKLVTDTGIHGLTSLNKPTPYTETASTTVHMLTTSTNAPNLDRQKQEKVKGSSNNSNDARTMDSATKKKVKRKPELQLTSAPGEERRKFQKQAVASLQKPNQQSAPPSRFESHS